MNRFLLLTALLVPALLLSACNTTFPSSALLNLLRGERQNQLAIEMRKHDFKLGQPVMLRVFKEERVVEAWLGDKRSGEFALYKTYPICNFSGSIGPKQREGDKQAPEGFYLIGQDQLNPNSQYHLAMNVGYPNAYDRAKGRTGSLLMIHGDCVSEGCFAMTDPGIEEIYLLVDNAMRNGQQFVNVHIFPFRMTDENMIKHAGSRWYGFWANLKQGHDAFEATHRAPLVGVENERYVFYDREMMSRALAAQNATAAPATGLAAGSAF